MEGNIGSTYMNVKDEEGNIYDLVKISIYSFSSSSNDKNFSSLENVIKLEDINAVVLVCDCSNNQTFSIIKDKWYVRVKNSFNNAFVVLAENKSDLIWMK